ncbi:MAG: DnaB-like helicase N-terminal domain-containing protein, partial [Candidatus Binatia bacterium]|nr:DnaB-like helicase N-terminal domain-containing protein [Candidatus Binatia bacterium]
MPSEIGLPQSTESERAILGAVLLNNTAWEQAAAIDASEFYLDSHRVIFSTMKDLIDRGAPVDLVTLSQELLDAHALDRVGGASYVSSLTDGLPRLENIGHYIKTVQEKARLRLMMAAGAEIVERAALGDESAVAAIAGAIPASRNGKGVLARTLPEVPEAAWCELARRYRNIVGGSTEASDNYHLASYLTVAGAVLGRLIWFNYPFPIYPNFYTALIGASSKARKSTAIRFAYQLGRAVNPELHWLRSVNSSEGMIQLMHDLQEKQHDRSSVSTVLRFGELRSLIDTAAREGTKNIVPVLLKAFEGTDRLERNTVKGVAAEQPNISII